MNVFWQEFFDGSYMPHGHCYLWQPGILWTNVISDLVIAASYFSIPIALIFFVRKRNEQKFRGMLLLFALFILSCGITHVFSVYTIWHGNYGLHGVLKAITAVVSAITAFVLFKNIDNIISIPTPSELAEAQQRAANAEVKKVQLEIENRANSIFQFSLELFPTGILVIDENQQIHIANHKLENIFGYEPGELTHKNIDILIESEHAPNHKVLVDNYMKTGAQKEMNSGRLVWGKTKQGHAVPVEVSLSTHMVEDKRYTFASLVSVNEAGSDKKRAVETSRRLQRAVDATDVGVWEWNLLTNKLWFSHKLTAFINTDKRGNELTVDDWKAHIHPEDVARVEEHLESHLQHKTVYDIVYRGRNKEQYQWVRTTGDTVFDNLGKPILMTGTMANVDKLQTLRIKMEKTAQEFSDTFEQAAVGISHVGLDGHWSRVNGRLCDILGYAREELESLSFQEVTYHEDLAKDEALVQQVLDGEIDSYVLEKRYLHKQGHIVWGRLTVSIVKNEKGENDHFISVIEDISQQKELELALLRSNDELEEFAYVASHDLKEPLRTLQTYTSYLIKDIAEQKHDRVAQDKEFIDEASTRMTTLIDDLLSFSRVGNTEMEQEVVDIHEVIQSVIADLSTVISDKKALVRCDDTFVNVLSDQSQLRLAIQNLVQNALKFCSNDTMPEIHIFSEINDENWVHISVKDNGIGIDEAYQEQIFGLFKKLHNATEYQGTGLGLAIVKKIMNRLGGNVSLHSKAGEGATFTLHLPRT